MPSPTQCTVPSAAGQVPIDLHIHTLASGHGTADTIAVLAKAARKKGMTLLGISDHGPATPGSCRDSYFRSLQNAPSSREGVALLYGAEANILDEQGRLDLSEDILTGLDYVIASIHPQSYLGDAAACTQAYLRAMEHPAVKIIGHPDDPQFPVDCEVFVRAAAQNHIIIEVNEVSLSPDGYREGAAPITAALLSLCKSHRLPIILSSDSHGAAHIGQVPRANALAMALGYPRELIVNYMSVEQVKELL